MRDGGSLGSVGIVLKEAIQPINYDEYLELSQLLLNAGGKKADIKTFRAMGQLIPATGNDPLTFYIDTVLDRHVIDKVYGVGGELLPQNYPLVTPPGGGAGVPPNFGPIPVPTDATMLNIPPFSQTDSSWARQLIDQCSAGNSMQEGGCGITSIAMVLKYFGENITPATIAQAVRGGIEYICGFGSSLPNLARFAYDQYGIGYQASIPFSAIEEHLKEGHPIVGSFGCFKFSGPLNCTYGHISLIKGIGRCTIGGVTDTCLYFQDPYIGGGEAAFLASDVINRFSTNYLYAFYQ